MRSAAKGAVADGGPAAGPEGIRFLDRTRLRLPTSAVAHRNRCDIGDRSQVRDLAPRDHPRNLPHRPPVRRLPPRVRDPPGDNSRWRRGGSRCWPRTPRLTPCPPHTATGFQVADNGRLCEAYSLIDSVELRDGKGPRAQLAPDRAHGAPQDQSHLIDRQDIAKGLEPDRGIGHEPNMPWWGRSAAAYDDPHFEHDARASPSSAARSGAATTATPTCRRSAQVQGSSCGRSLARPAAG